MIMRSDICLQALCIQMGEVCTVASTTAAELPPEPTPLPVDPKLEAKVCLPWTMW